MADLPEITGATGADALERAMQADREATVAAMRRERVAAEKRAARAEAKLAQVEGSGVSAAEFATHGDFVGGGGLNTDFAKQLQADLKTRDHNKRQKRMDLESEADRIAADFANDQAVQRDKEREAAEAAAEMAKAFHATASVATVMVSAMGSVASALNQLESNRAQGAKTVGDTRQTIDEAVQALGGRGRAKDIIARAESGGFGALSPQDVARLLADRASYARSNPGAPPLLDETLDVIADAGRQNRSVSDAAAAISSPLPGVAASMQDMTRRGARTSGGTQIYRGGQAGRETDVYQAEAKKFQEGIDRANEEARVRALSVEDAAGAAGGAMYRTFGNVIGSVQRYFQESHDQAVAEREEERHQEQLAELRRANAKPPSTTAGQ